MRARLLPAALSLTLASTVLLGSGCSAAPAPGPTASSVAAVRSAGAPAGQHRRAETLDSDQLVLAISVDGLRSSALTQLDASQIPTFTRLRAEGAGTLNARTEVEQTETLPDHTSMMTSRRIDADHGGHGVTWDTDEPGTTVQQAAGHGVESVFSRVHQAGGTTALFTGKTKFSLYQRSWPKGIDRYTYAAKGAALVRKTRKDLRQHTRTFTFLHLAAPDLAGHANGWDSPEYLQAVRDVDGWLGDILATVESKPVLRKHLTIVLTADHGGSGYGHTDPTVLSHYRIPFLTWGVGVAAGDLYDLNADYADPHKKRPGYGKAKQPVRNGDVGNLALGLLGLAKIPGSELDADQDLDLS